jgi:hypothetical protein
MTATAALFVAPIIAIGSSISDYQIRLDKAHKDIESVISVLQSGKQGTDIEDQIKQTCSRVRKEIPSSEAIEIHGAGIETENDWLRSDLDKFDQTSDRAEQIKILSGISERLSSIEDRVKELADAAAPNRTKDEDKQKLNEILSREEYQKPEDKGKSAFQRWLDWFLNWLRSLLPDRSPLPKVDPAGLQPLSVVIQVIVYGLVIALIGFLIYKFAPVIAERFKQKEKKERSGRVILGEHIDASRSASDIFAEAERFARRGDLRGAIRKGYVAMLCDLADKKVIGLARHKTNRDYLRDVRKRASLFAHLKFATGSFERHWYGFRMPEEEDWEEFREQYRSAVNEL